MKILLITGPASEVQGWGDAKTTERIRATLKASGRAVETLHIDDMDDLLRGLDEIRCDLVWSSIYQISKNTNFIGLNFEDPWVADILESRGIPYVGSSVPVLKTMLDKAATRELLANQGVAVPRQAAVEIGEKIPAVEFPVFVKPRYESQSAGVSEGSIAHAHGPLVERVRYIHEEFSQCALIEEFLPGAELTVSMLGERQDRGPLYHPAIGYLDPSTYEEYPVIMTDIDGVLELERAGAWAAPAEALAASAVAALDCRDHVRVDMREDAKGHLRILEVNGIPSLSPGVGRSFKIHGLYNPSLSAEDCYTSLILSIVESALYRAGLGERSEGALRSEAETPTTAWRSARFASSASH